MFTLRDSLRTKSLTLLFVFTALVLSNCKSVQKQDDRMGEVKSILKSTDESEIECIDNTSGLFTLCKNNFKEKPQNPDQLLIFLVLKKESNKIIYSNSVTGGYVKWLDSERLEFYSQPGIIPDGKTKNDYTKIYNVVTNELITKNKFILGAEDK